MSTPNVPPARRRVGWWVATVFLLLVALVLGVAVYGLLGPARRAAVGPALPDAKAPSPY
jgi:hypothetical protein